MIDIRCPECNGGNLSKTGAGLRRCPQCGATFTYRIRWVLLLGTAVALGMLLGLTNALLFEGKATFMIGPLVILGIILMGRRFRKLQKVGPGNP